MPSGKNWLYFIYVNVAFILYVAGVFYYNQMAQVKANWPLYRCNPMYMALADNVEENFVYCIQSMQGNFMGYLLQPLTYITGTLTSSMGGFMNDVQNIRAMFNKIRTFFSSIVQSIFAVFLNLIIEFQKITIGIKDLIGKTIGIMVSLMYIMDGSVKTMNSTWNGPPGQMVRSLGKCFHPNTKITLQNNQVKCMKDVHLGDILSDGSIVEAVMQIDNKHSPISLYKIENKQQTNLPIYVTGSHLIYDKTTRAFIRVDHYNGATVCPEIITEWFSCLITNTHHIPIGTELFWDWEDHFVKHSLSCPKV
jgi:hypothetical protein